MMSSMGHGRAWSLLEVDIAVRGRSDDALAAIEWFWTNGPTTEVHSQFLRRARSWCEDDAVRTLFLRLRPNPPVRKERVFPSLMNWLALNSLLGLEHESLAWFDARVAEGDLPLPQMHRLQAAVLRRGRLRDWLAFQDPVAAVRDEVSLIPRSKEILGEFPEVLAGELEELDGVIALWRCVAEAERPHELSEIDALVDDCERAAQIREWLARPLAELLAFRLQEASY